MDQFNRTWILETGVPIVQQYDGLTIRALYYRLVAVGMTNTIRHYKRVQQAMTDARWDGTLPFGAFVDYDRQMEGQTDAEETDLAESIIKGKQQIKNWMTFYHKNRWENQEVYPEVFIEKKALQGVFMRPCEDMDIALCPCKGYPSLTYLYDASQRFQEAEANGKHLIILYFGDYDPSGEDIPRSIKENLSKMGVEVEVKRILLMKEQVIKWNLPPAPTKTYKIGKRKDGSIGYVGDTREKNWDGLGQVELDAIEPNKLKVLISEAIDEIFDYDLYAELMEQEDEEEKEYRIELKEYVNSL